MQYLSFCDWVIHRAHFSVYSMFFHASVNEHLDLATVRSAAMSTQVLTPLWPIIGELLDLPVEVGIGSFVDLIEVQPDLLFATVDSSEA